MRRTRPETEKARGKEGGAKWKCPSLPFYVHKREGADLLNAPNVDVIDFVLLAVLQQVVEDLARAEHDALRGTGSVLRSSGRLGE